MVDQNDWENFVNPQQQEVARDEMIQRLIQQIGEHHDKMKEERFFWILTLIIAIDCAIFPHLGWLGMILIFVLQILLLIGLAYVCGLDRTATLLESLYHKILHSSWFKS